MRLFGSFIVKRLILHRQHLFLDVYVYLFSPGHEANAQER